MVVSALPCVEPNMTELRHDLVCTLKSAEPFRTRASDPSRLPASRSFLHTLAPDIFWARVTLPIPSSSRACARNRDNVLCSFVVVRGLLVHAFLWWALR